MIRIVILEKRKKFISDLVDSLPGDTDLDPFVASSPYAAETELNRSGSAILIVGPSQPFESAVELVEKLNREGRSLGCILVVDEPSAELLKQALRSGFRDVVDSNPGEIVEAIDRIKALNPVAVAVGGDESQEKQPERVVTFLSAKGGVGKTVALTNTAVALAEQKVGRVLVLDLDDQFGDIGVMLGLRPERTISDLLPVADRLDADMLESFLTHHSSGLDVLLAPVQYRQGQHIPQRHLQKIFDAAREAADFIIVDTPVSFVGNAFTVIDNSDYIFLVTTLDVPSIKSTQIALQTLELVKFPEDSIKLLLNRADSKVSLLPADVERQLKHRISVKIPSNLAVPRSVNEGVPLLMADKKTAVAEAFGRIVDLTKSLSQDNLKEKRAERAMVR